MKRTYEQKIELARFFAVVFRKVQVVITLCGIFLSMTTIETESLPFFAFGMGVFGFGAGTYALMVRLSDWAEAEQRRISCRRRSRKWQR